MDSEGEIKGVRDSMLNLLHKRLEASRTISDLQAERLTKLAAVCDARMVIPPAGLLFLHCPICEGKIKTSHVYFMRQKLDITHIVCTRCPYEYAERTYG